MIEILIKELKIFFRQNWWIFLIFFVCLFLIYKTNSGNIFEVSLVFVFHFLGDLCVMMMGDYYAKKEEKKGLLAQTWSFIIFGLIGLYAGIFQNKWSYIAPQILFIWPILKWFFKNLSWIDYKFISFVWILLFLAYYYFWIITNFWVFIQVLWFIIFPTSLILENEKKRYFGSLIWIWFIFFGSAFMLYQGFIHKNIAWIDVSYTLLPFTVFVFYLKNLKKYI